MKFFRHTFFLMGTVLLLASCMQHEVLEIAEDPTPEPLGFDVYSARPGDLTKADDTYVPTGTGHLPSGSQFGVFAYLHDEKNGNAGSWTDDNNNHPNLMYNQPVSVTKNADNSYSYDYNPKRYWPKNDKQTISFYAYYPYDPYQKDVTPSTHGIMHNLDKNTDGMGALRFNLSEDVTRQVDFLVSDLCMDQSKKDGRLTGSSAGGDEGKVRFTFHHVLAQVRVNVIKVTSENPKIVIDEDSFKFRFYRFPVAGTCIPDPGTAQLNGYTPCTFNWDNQMTTVVETIEGVQVERDSKMEVPSYSDPGDPDHDDFLLVIPHTVGDNERLEVTFDLTRSDYHNEAYSYANNPLFGYLKGKISAFEAGKIYTFNLTVGLNEIKFDAEVSDWTSGSGDVFPQ